VDGVLFGTPEVGGEGGPVCAMAQVRGVCGYGKGITQAAALVSALGEALEQYAARQVPRGALIRAPFCKVMAQAFDPRWLCLYARRQYQRPGFPFSPFDAGRPMLWTQGWWLDTQEAVLLPAAATYLSCALEREDALCQTTSNGLAAGVSLQDAASRATLELYERGEFLRAWITCQPGELVDVDSLDPEYTLLVEAMQSRGSTLAPSVKNSPSRNVIFQVSRSSETSSPATGSPGR